jgi:hypothetical protein
MLPSLIFVTFIGAWCWMAAAGIRREWNRPDRVRERIRRAQPSIARTLSSRSLGVLVRNDLDGSRLELNDSRREATFGLVLTPEAIRLEVLVSVSAIGPEGAVIDRSLAPVDEFAQSEELGDRLVVIGPDPEAQLRRLSQRQRQLLADHALPNVAITRDRVQVSAELSNAAEADAWIRANMEPILALATALRQHERELARGTR